MSIFEKLFGQPAAPAPAAAAQPQSQSTPGNLPATPTVQTASTPGAAPNGVVPDTVAASATQSADPLDQFKDIWQPTDKQKQGPEPLINFDPKAIAEASKKTDFSKLINPEQLQAIGQGGEAAMQAFATALNSVAQGVYAQSTFATSKIVEQAVAKAQENWNAELPSHVKKLNLTETLQTENPAFSHPAASPILGAIQAQLTQKYPNASSQELATMAKNYLGEFASAIQAPSKKAEESKNAAATPQETDWSTFA